MTAARLTIVVYLIAGLVPAGAAGAAVIVSDGTGGTSPRSPAFAPPRRFPRRRKRSAGHRGG
jgi:hypothetical protein